MPTQRAPVAVQSPADHAAHTSMHALQRHIDDHANAAAPSQQLVQMQSDSMHYNPYGLPPRLRVGIETLSGMDMSDVTVRRNSPRPAQLSAAAYAQGNEIHLGPSQEQYLPHEAWHVVQQRQGRVAPTTRVSDVHINDDEGLEREADVMGQKALQTAIPFNSGDERSATVDRSETSRSVPQRKVAQRVSHAGSFHTIQLGKGDKTDPSEPLEEEIGGQLVVRGNVVTNLKLLSMVWRFLPPVVQAFLSEIYGELSRRETDRVIASSGDDEALVPRDRQHDTPWMRILNLDPSIIQNVVVGLYMMPSSQQRSLRTMQPLGLMTLFSQLATAKYFVPLSLMGPPEGIRTGRTGAEHIQNSCYAAAILNIIARNAYYRRMFDPTQNPTPPHSPGRLMQITILPLVQQIYVGGTVSADQMRTLIANLNRVGLLMGEGDGEALEREQQDASDVLMGVLNLIGLTQPLTSRETRVYDHVAPNQVETEDEFVLHLYAHGHRNLLEALLAHFVQGKHSSVLHAGPLAQPHTVTRAITHFPEMLSIGVVRLDEYDSINMPRQFTVPAQIIHGGLPGPTYRLTAYVVRNTISHKTGGHYIAVVGHDDGSWDAMDDMGTPKQGEQGVWSPSTQQVDPSLHRIGGHHAPSYAMATLYTYRLLQADEVEQGGATIEFDSGWMMQHPVLGDLLMESGLTGKAIKERERLVDKFLKSGGTIWDAYTLMAAWPTDNAALMRAFLAFEITPSTLSYTSKEASHQGVQGLLPGFASMSISEMLRLQVELEKILTGSSEIHVESLRQQLIGLDLAIKTQRFNARKGFDKFFEASNSEGMKVEIYGTDRMLTNPTAAGWAQGIALTLIKAPFLARIRPPLQIRINLRPQVTTDIASTIGHGNIIKIDMDDYQATLFTLGESLGLLAHEIGVHSLDNSIMSSQALTAEEKDKASLQTGTHGKTTYTVGRDPKSKRQQDDHLTIGRAILGQPSALPRLQMYEQTLLSILCAAPQEAKKEMAAAYCIDVARIIVLNDQANKLNEAGFFGKIEIAHAIANAAEAEWLRIQAKYGEEFPEILKITLSYFDIGKYLFRLKSVLEKVDKQATKGKRH